MYDDEVEITDLGKDDFGSWGLVDSKCLSCRNRWFALLNGDSFIVGTPQDQRIKWDKVARFEIIHPRSSGRPPCPEEVPEEIAADYTEACIVLPFSTKASAALSRRCLQHILVVRAGVKKKDLKDQIEEVLKSQALPVEVARMLDAVRHFGNFAAHPSYTATAEIVDVEAGEADLCLDVLEALFEFYFVRPAFYRKKAEEVNERLEKLGKPLLPKLNEGNESDG